MKQEGICLNCGLHCPPPGAQLCLHIPGVFLIPTVTWNDKHVMSLETFFGMPRR